MGENKNQTNISHNKRDKEKNGPGGAQEGGGAPLGNTNAMKHGAYATVIRDQLSEEEKQIYDQMPEDSSLNEELKVLRFKLVRLLTYDPLNLDNERTKVAALTKLTDQIRKIAESQDAPEVDTGLLESLVEAIKDKRGE